MSEVIDEIAFRFLQPMRRVPRGWGRVDDLLRRRGWTLEWLNTALPRRLADRGRRLRPLCLMPKMSTFAIGAVLNAAVADMPPGAAYVNVGVWNGFSFLAGLEGNPTKRCIGVDDFSEFHGPREAFLERFGRHRAAAHEFHETGYERYFHAVHRGPIGVYFYDGAHSYAEQLAGLQAAEPFFTERCLVIVDDTNWTDPRQATLDFVRQSRYRYQLVADRPTVAIKHPTFWNGLMMLRREP
jgi:hypothetical protein